MPIAGYSFVDTSAKNQRDYKDLYDLGKRLASIIIKIKEDSRAFNKIKEAEKTEKYDSNPLENGAKDVSKNEIK